MPSHIATIPAQILGHFLLRTAGKAKGVGESDCEEFHHLSERFTRKRLLTAEARNGRSRTLLPQSVVRKNSPQIRGPLTPGTHEHNNPAKTLGKHLNIWVAKWDHSEGAGGGGGGGGGAFAKSLPGP